LDGILYRFVRGPHFSACDARAASGYQHRAPVEVRWLAGI